MNHCRFNRATCLTSAQWSFIPLQTLTRITDIHIPDVPHELALNLGGLGVVFGPTSDPYNWVPFNLAYVVTSDPSTVPPIITTVRLLFVVPDNQYSIQIGFSGDGIYTPPSISSAVPEPSTWAMLLIGFAGIGFATLHQQLGTVISNGADQREAR
jgi:hypothetical protein